MKKRKSFVVFGCIVLFLGLGYMTMRCVGNLFTEGIPGISSSIEESKERGVFAARLIPASDTVVVMGTNGTVSIPIEEAWIERLWEYGKGVDKTVVGELRGAFDYQLLLKVSRETYIGLEEEKGFSWQWDVRIAPQRYLGRAMTQDAYLFIGHLDNLPEDILHCVVQKGTNISPHAESSHVDLDTFSFVVKRE